MNFRSVIVTHWLLIEEHEHLMDISLFLTICQFHRRNDILSILSRRRCICYYGMCMEEHRNRRNTIPVTSLVHLSISPAGSDQVYITAFGVDVNRKDTGIQRFAVFSSLAMLEATEKFFPNWPFFLAYCHAVAIYIYIVARMLLLLLWHYPTR